MSWRRRVYANSSIRPRNLRRNRESFRIIKANRILIRIPIRREAPPKQPQWIGLCKPPRTRIISITLVIVVKGGLPIPILARKPMVISEFLPIPIRVLTRPIRPKRIRIPTPHGFVAGIRDDSGRIEMIGKTNHPDTIASYLGVIS